jgi:hypothetical protein
METRELNVNFPEAVKGALIQEAETTNNSMNDIAVGILAAYFKVPFTPTGRPYRGTKNGSGVVILRRVPARLDQKIEAEKSKRTRGKTKEAVVVSVVAEALGVEVAAAA